jgi:plastocyanin
VVEDGEMQRMSSVVVAVATAALAVGGWGMAQAAPARHTDAAHSGLLGAVGEDESLVAARSTQGLPRLRGVVNDDRDLTLSDTSVAPGRYKIIINDSTRRHNWHIFGNGVDKETSVRDTGRWSWKVRLRAGTYTVVCDPHAQTMRFTVRVG